MLDHAHLLVPTDGSRLAERAEPVALGLARRLGARTVVIAVAPAERDLGRTAADLAAVAGRLDVAEDARRILVEPRPAHGIVQVARELDRALVCMASHGHGRSAAALGSVAGGVLAELGEPVLLVGPLAAPGPADAPVVVTVDGSVDAEAPIDLAAEWAATLGVALRIVTVAEPVPAPVGGGVAHRVHGPDGDVGAYLDGLVARAGRPGGAPVEAVVIDDPIGAGSGLRTWLPDHPAQLIVAGTHARSGLRRALAGSAAAHIVHVSPVPVLLVPPR